MYVIGRNDYEFIKITHSKPMYDGNKLIFIIGGYMTESDINNMTKEELERNLDEMNSYGILTDYEIYLHELMERRYAILNKTHS